MCKSYDVEKEVSTGPIGYSDNPAAVTVFGPKKDLSTELAKKVCPRLRDSACWQPTGCPAVDVTTLIAHISLLPGPIIKPFHSMKVKMIRISLVYDKSSYRLYYPISGMNLFLTRFSQK